VARMLSEGETFLLQ